MTQDERNKVGTAIAYTAQYYGREFKKEVLAMMVSDLEDLSATAVLDTLNRYRKDPRSKTFPLPAQIRDMISPTVNHDAKAREIAGRIQHAITRFGYSNPQEAQNYIGEVGWDVIQSSGGWSYLCQNHGVNIDPGQFMAQTRDRLKDHFQFGKSAIVKEIGHQPKAETLQIEAQRQRAAFNEWQENQAPKKTDPNEAYLLKSPDERKEFINQFIEKMKGRGA